jgi:hypothetical protein
MWSLLAGPFMWLPLGRPKFWVTSMGPIYLGRCETYRVVNPLYGVPCAGPLYEITFREYSEGVPMQGIPC